MNRPFSRKIFKYVLQLGATTKILIPEGAVIRHVGLDTRLSGTGALWAEVDPDASTESWSFKVIGTGDTVPDGDYLGSFKQPHGLIWHVYELVI